MAQEFEDVLTLVGSYGRYQKMIVWFIMIPTSLLIAFGYNLTIFQALVPENYWCNPSGRHLTNLSQEQWWNLTIPRTNSGNYEKCQHYHVEIENEILMHTNESLLKDCKKGDWVHDKKGFDESFATTNQWLCKEEIFSTHVLSMNNAGNAVGTFFLPIFADKFTGRRLMFYIANGFHAIFNAFLLFTPPYGIVLALKFIAGLSFQTNFQMPYIIGLELTSPDRRAEVSFYSFVAWTAGMCLTALVGWLVPHWWTMVLVSVIPSVAFFIYWKYLPESPRWLLAKGRTSECCDILLKIAKVNKIKNVNRIQIEKMLEPLSKVEENMTFKELFKYKKFLLHAVTIIPMSFCVFAGYGCTLLNVKILPNNYYLSFFVLSFSELPSNILSYLSVHYLGRKFTIVITTLATAAFCFMATFITDNPVAMLCVVAVIKIFITQGLYVVYVITSELFPTPSRSSGMGFVIVSGMIGIIFAPYIVQASDDGKLQYWIMLGLNAAALLFALPLLETLGLPLPQTYREANSIGHNRPYLAWINHWNKHKYESDKQQKTYSKDNVEEEKVLNENGVL